MGKRKDFLDHLVNPGEHMQHLKDKRRHPLFAPLFGSWNRGPPKDWQDLQCDLLCKIAHRGEYPQMRLACKKWRDELDACTYLLVPSVCHAHKILQRFSQVHELDLSSCTLTVQDECLETLAGMKKLQSIDLRGCVKVTANGIGKLARCTTLKAIALGRDPDLAPGEGGLDYDSKVNDDMLEALQSIQQLKSIEIGYSFKCTKGAVLGLAQLTDLETLHIMGHSADDFGKLGREDMLNLAQLKMLKDLRLGVVAADGFQALPQFHRLTTLDLYGDTWECLPLQAEDLSHLASLTGLQHLGLHHFEISGSLKSFSHEETSPLRFLQSLTKLESIQFSSCQVASGCELLMLESCKGAKRVQVKLLPGDDPDTQPSGFGSGSGDRAMAKIAVEKEWALEDLVVQASTCVPDFAATALSRASHLTSLKWDCSKASAEQHAVWHDLHIDRWCCQQTLETLQFGSRVKLSAAALAPLEGFPRLRNLSSALEKHLPPSTARLDSLQRLCITWESGADKGLQHLGQLTGLQSLTLGCQESIADSGLHNLSSLTNLTELIFHSSGTESQVSKRGLEAIASLEKLQRLDLVSSLVLEPEALYPLSRLQQLRHLDVGNFQYITNEVLEALGPLDNLRRLWLRIPKEQMWQERAKSIRVTKQAMVELARGHPVLAFVCFGNQQMMSLPHVAIDQQLLQDLVEADRNGSLDSIEDPFWLQQDEEGTGV